MAETIGRAYIKVIADGSGVPDDIRQMMRDADKHISEAGDRQSKLYRSQWKRNLKNFEIGKDLEDALKRGLERSDLAQDYFQSRNWKNFNRKLRDEFGDAGAVAAHQLTDEFVHNLDGLDSAVERVPERIRRIRQEMDALGDEDHDPFATIIDKVDTFINSADRAGDEVNTFRLRFHTLRRDMRDAGDDTSDFSRRIGELSDGVGRAFGKGSRNNFVNFFGSLIGGITGSVRIIPALTSKLSGFFSVLTENIGQAEGGGAKFGAALEGIGAGLTEMVAKLGPAAIGIAAFAALIAGPIVSALWLLLGAVTSLISTLSFGLIGALAPIAGLLGPIALAAGAVAAALIGMDNKTKKLMKEAIEPLKQDLKDLGDAARPGILRGIQVAAENLKQPMKDLEPVFQAAGDGIATFSGAFTGAFTGPGFNKFVSVMQHQMPTIMQQIGDAAGHIFDGLLGVLGVLNRKGGPVEQFLGWLTGISEAFDDWSTQKGPNGAAKFFDDAADSAGALQDVISPLWDIITDLMSAGKPHGDSLMESLGAQLKALSDWLKEHPDEVEQWMQDSEDFARALGQLALAIIAVADALDTPGGRKIVIFMTQMTSLVIGPLASQLEQFAQGMNALGSVKWGAIGSGIGNVAKAIGKGINVKGIHIDWRAIIGGPGAITTILQSVIIKAFSGAAGMVRRAMGHVDLSGIIAGAGKVFNAVVGPFRGLARDVLLRIGTFNVVDIVLGLGSVAREIINAFPSANEILHAIGTFDIMDVVDGLASVAGNILGAFPSASEILSAIGHIDLSSLMHGSFTLPGGKKISWAGGGLVFGPTFGQVGEAGPEAIVPLARPLHMVDPAVRELSAIAQGLRVPTTTGVQKVVEMGGVTIITPTKDPAAVAQEVVNRLVAVGY